MTKKPTTCFEYQSQNPAYQALSQQITDLHQIRQSLEGKLSQMLWDVQAAIRAIDACRSLMYRGPESPKSDKDLEALTGEDAEAWSGNWCRSADVCRDSAASLCQQVAELETARRKNREQIDRLCEESNELATKLRLEWHKQQESAPAA